MSKSYPVLTFLQIRTMEVALRELYAALKHRNTCVTCGGDGVTWSMCDDEPEPEPCVCAEQAYELLEKYKHLDVT